MTQSTAAAQTRPWRAHLVLSAVLALSVCASAQPPATHPVSAPSSQPESAPAATQPADAPAVAADDPQRSPWAAMKVFLIRASESKTDPGRVADAMACLDMSELSPEEIEVQGPRLVNLLDTIINYYGVDLEAIPDESAAPPYVFLQTEAGKLELARQADGRWRFTAASVDAILPIHHQVRKAATTQIVDAPAGVPSDRRSPRAAMRGFLKALDDGDIRRAADCLDLSDVSESSRAEIGRARAVKLGEVIRRAREVVLAEIPDDTGGFAYRWYTDRSGHVEIARQEGGPRKGEWLFTTETVTSIDALYRALEARPATGGGHGVSFWRSPSLWLREQMPAALKAPFGGLERWQWLGVGVLLLLGVVVRSLVAALLGGIARAVARYERVELVASARAASLRPLSVLAMVALWWAGLQWLDLGLKIETVLSPAVRFVFTAVGVWAVYRIVDLASDIAEGRAQRSRIRLNVLLVPLLRKTIKLSVAIVGMIMIVRALGMREEDVNKIIAGLGLGGLAFTLAAQDTIRNFFGSFVVVLDPPFQVGDTVKIGEVEGTVESVGLRSLRIRTASDSQVTIPNSNLTGTTVDNLGARRWRRFATAIALRVTTRPARLEAFCEGVRELLRRHPLVAADRIAVFVGDVDGAKVEVHVGAVLNTRDAAVEQRERHRLLMDIIRLAARLRIEFASAAEALEPGAGDDPLADVADDTAAAIERGRREADALVALLGGYVLVSAADQAGADRKRT